ncbi:MAG: hypothetical protein ACRD2O_00685 [Terriglobia bacterium]
MRALKVALPIVILGCTIAVFGQDSSSPPSTDSVPAQDVIVPWRHFGPEPAASSPPSTEASPGCTLSAGSVPSSTSMSDSSGDSETSQAQPQNPQITEEDISKKHPHPPEQIQIPIANQDVKPLQNSGSETSSVESQSGEQGSASALSESSPEAEVASLTTDYEKRETDREAHRHQLEKAAAKDPATQALAKIQETRLLLEGEQDRMKSAQQLSQALAALADEIADRAAQVRGMIENRKQIAELSDAELDGMNDRAPQLELALRNIAMLPPSAGNNQMIRRLDAELAQDDTTHKLDEARSLQARHEAQSLQADADELNKEAVEARQKSASFAKAAQDARLNEGRLADRLEFAVTRQRAADMLSSTTKAIASSVTLTSNAAINSAVMGSSAASVPTDHSVDQLRDCIRKSGDVEACRAKGVQ